MNYQDAAAKLTGRNAQRRKVANNTYLERRSDDTIALRLHNTDILTYHSNGNVVVTVYRWRTVTTKARLNDFMPYGFSISQRKGQWYLQRFIGSSWEDLAMYEDGLTLCIDGSFVGGSPIENATKAQKLRKQVANFSKAYIAELKAGNVPAPGPGDCWGCYMVDVKTKQAAFRGEDHILAHMRDKYYVPSLLVRAIENFPVSQVAKWVLGSHWSNVAVGSFGAEIGYEQLQKALYRYCLRELGQAS